jgi:predicted anti-sigma-YlaC factor YlaD
VNRDLHQRANELLSRLRVEPLSREDDSWLSAHLAECESCAATDAQMADALAALRVMHINVPRNLASRTQLRVRMRAAEMREHGPANRLIWAVAVMSWIFGLVTAPFVWRGFEWVGGELHLPKLVWMAGVVLWWVVPSLAATGMVLLGQKGHAGALD